MRSQGSPYDSDLLLETSRALLLVLRTERMQPPCHSKIVLSATNDTYKTRLNTKFIPHASPAFTILTHPIFLAGPRIESTRRKPLARTQEEKCQQSVRNDQPSSHTLLTDSRGQKRSARLSPSTGFPDRLISP